VSERAWGTVREDYSADGDAWSFFPHDHARSRAYRWNEDGLAGICDDRQTLCLALAFWNGADPILKERIFGLTNVEGNHGEDAKEYWWYLDSTPTHSWMRWRYMYPQAAFPYAELIEGNAGRTRLESEFELADTGAFADGRYWEISADFAKATPEDLLLRGPETASIDVLPTLWFRNTWSWGLDDRRPDLAFENGNLVATHRVLGRRVLGSDGSPEPLFCENETNTARLFGSTSSPPYPKDGINDHVVGGAATVNPALQGTKAAFRHHLEVAPGATVELRLRLTDGVPDLGVSFAEVMKVREAEADLFYQTLTQAHLPADDANVMRQAMAGMLWSKQYYHYEVQRWLEGDPAGPPPPEGRLEGRNTEWVHLDNRDVISMPDKWEYPWYAAWDLGFHCLPLAHLDPEFAKSQLILLCREWFMHPNGQLPAYEWAFGDVNPPVHAWAALRVFEIDGNRDFDFLERIFHKLILNFTWWVNRKDAEGRNIFEGGFLGLDNIGPFDRSAQLPVMGVLQQADGTAWMAMYCLTLLEVALRLAANDRTYEDIATKFFEHFTLIALAMNKQGLWNQEDGLYYDVLHRHDGEDVPIRARSMVGLIPLLAVTVIESQVLDELTDFGGRMEWYTHARPELTEIVQHIHVPGKHGKQLLSIVGPDRLRRLLGPMLDEEEFLSPHGLRALSKRHLDQPLHLDLGGLIAGVDYEPGESTTGLFGGNSNWRGPIWFPLNHLVIGALLRFHSYLGDDFRVECPTGSGKMATLHEVADEIARRLSTTFLNDADGRRPVFGDNDLFQKDPAWHDLILFYEYFHGDTGKGLGASHQTGWTGLVADLLMRPPLAP